MKKYRCNLHAISFQGRKAFFEIDHLYKIYVRNIVIFDLTALRGRLINKVMCNQVKTYDDIWLKLKRCLIFVFKNNRSLTAICSACFHALYSNGQILRGNVISWNWLWLKIISTNKRCQIIVWTTITVL